MDDSEFSVVDSPRPAAPRGSLPGCLAFVLAVLVGSLLYGAFASAGMFLLWRGTLGPIIQSAAAMTWEEVPCVITSSRVVGKKTFEIEIEYQYEFKGETYKGNRYSFFNQKSAGRRLKMQIVQQHRVGLETVCYVNPLKPEESVLSRRWNLNLLWGLVGIPFLMVGVIGFRGMIRYHKRKANASGRQQEDISTSPEIRDEPGGVPTLVEVSQSDFTDEDLQEEPGPVILKPTTSRLAAFGGLLVVTVFWNGVISIFLMSCMKDWMQGKWNWLPELILIPFTLIGIGLIFATIHNFLGLFNPFPTVTLSRQMIPLGGQATLSWEFNRVSTALRKITITLRGMEWAKYRRGSTTSIDTSVFHEQVLVDSIEPTTIQSGEIEIEVPTDTMHSLTASNNAIKWQIHFTAEVARWPDLKAEFPIRVVPHE